ncbi:MAG: T9SS type A sorting domain-containing protein [Bacteroidia bacterium]|nr:T9SS type A sorting domain-containing protein [Bacteroidia bacterium]
MKSLRTLAYLAILFFSFSQNCFSTHLLGGELNYQLIDSSTLTYEVELRVYRDCIVGQAPFDSTISLFIFEKGSAVSQTQTIALGNDPNISLLPDSLILCSISPYYFCLESRVYKTQISLAPSSLGYDVVWARCCLTNALVNLVNPLGGGLTYSASIPRNDSILNSSPAAYNQLYDNHCSNAPFSFDFSTTDPDGDSLVYVLSEIKSGLNTLGLGAGNPMQGGPNPTVDPFNNPMGTPPYALLPFLATYNSQNPLNANSLQLDPETGVLSGDGVLTGIYLIGIEIQEYRNGNLLSNSQRIVPLSFTSCLNSGLQASLDFLGQETLVNGIPVLDYQDSTLLCISLLANSPDSSDVIRIFQRNSTPGLRINPASGSSPFQADICWRYDSVGLADTCFLVELIVGSDIACPNTERFEFSFAVCYDSARTALSIERQLTEIPVILYPNPGKDYLELETEADFFNDPPNIRLLSLDGRLQLVRKFLTPANKYRLDTSSLSAGVYILEFNTSRGRSIRKWIKE